MIGFLSGTTLFCFEGAMPVTLDEELKRVVPVIEGIKREYPSGLISIDTYKAEVARAAVAAGANMVFT